MKKITLSVATLSIAMMSYGQCTTNPVEEECRQIHFTTSEIIDAIRMDMHYGRIAQKTGNYYLNEVIKLQGDVQGLVNTINQSQLAFDEEVSDYLNEILTFEEWNALTSKINDNE